MDHYFTLLSVVPAWRVETVTELVNKVQGHQWVAAKRMSEFDPTQDTVAALVLRCSGRRLAVVIVDDPYEPYHNPSVREFELLDNEHSEELRSVTGEAKWVPLIRAIA